MKILITDDSKDSLRLQEKILNQAGFTDVICVRSAEKAFDLLNLDNPDKGSDIDLILMDVVMPQVDGIEACRQIKSREHLQDIPLIMMTAMADKEILENAFNAGAMDYITKMTDRVVFLARVRSALSLKKERDKRKAREKELIAATRLLEKANEKLHAQTFLDGLTGVANRRRFDEYLNVEWKRSRRNSTPFSLIMIDIDQFKPYNDNYGHLAGDDCLKEVASILQKSLERPADLLARYGGEEFAALLPETDAEGARKLAENIRSSVEEANLPHEYSTVHDRVTISLGVSTATPGKINSSKNLIRSADKALYHAKQNGRNQVSTATPPAD